MKKLFYLVVFAAFSSFAQPQPFFNYEHIDINNFNQRVMLHGDMWWDNVSSAPKCEYPKGSGKHALFAGAIWMAGYDNQAQLHVASQTYRQSGNDYWPGPLDATGTLSLTTSTDWARIWKINKTTIDSFKLIPLHTPANTHPSILEWPALNNPYAKGANGNPLTVTTAMAPFIDADKDGKYNPLKGDYPAIKGDQMLWWVFSDKGPTHDHSQTQPLVVEVHAAAYGYKHNSLIDNVVYYEFSVQNKSTSDYQAFRVGIWTDADLGYFQDDYIGFDSTRRLGYIYNGSAVDGTGAPEHYGSNLPIAGITVIKEPNDNPGQRAPAGSFMYFNNDNSGQGNPQNGADHNDLLRATWRDGSHLTYGGNGHGGTVNTNYAFPGDPGINTQWSECAMNNAPGDRRFVIATGDYEFKKGSTIQYIFAVVATPLAPNNGCPGVTTTILKEVADTATKHFGDPVSVQTLASQSQALKIYPNPASGKLFIDAVITSDGLLIYDATGKRHSTNVSYTGGKTEIDLTHLAPGLYKIIYRSGETALVNTFIRE